MGGVNLRSLANHGPRVKRFSQGTNNTPHAEFAMFTNNPFNASYIANARPAGSSWPVSA